VVITACGTGGVTGPEDHAAISIKNAQPDSTIGWLYYSLDGDSVVAPSQASGATWDIRMAYLKCCGQTQQIDILLNSGTAGAGSSQGATVSSRWESLASVPSDPGFRTEDTTKALRIVTPEVIGPGVMFVYDVQTHTLRPSPDRVLLIKTRAGNVYKFQFTSIYKDAVSAPDLNTPLGFYHFRYQQAINGAF